MGEFEKKNEIISIAKFAIKDSCVLSEIPLRHENI